jgi:carbon starvation protein CstA
VSNDICRCASETATPVCKPYLQLLSPSLVYGQVVAAHPYWGSLTLYLMAYGFIASVLPVWLLLAPRDYLSTPATTMAQMRAVVFNDHIDAFMTAFFMLVVVAMLVFAMLAVRRTLNTPTDSASLVKGFAQ